MINQVKTNTVIALDRLIRSKASNEKIVDWYNKSGGMYSNTDIKNTLRAAGREDLKGLIIKEEDISIGDKVKSRLTNREGKVIKIHWDGDTITVKWETGGVQPLSKESVYKLNGAFDPEKQNYSKVRTDLYGYDGMTGKDTDFTKVHDKENK